MYNELDATIRGVPKSGANSWHNDHSLSEKMVPCSNLSINFLYFDTSLATMSLLYLGFLRARQLYANNFKIEC